MRLAEWLLITGHHQINNDLRKIELLSNQTNNSFQKTILIGRKRELLAAKSLLLLLWGNSSKSYELSDKRIGGQAPTSNQEYAIDLLLKDKSNKELLSAVTSRIAHAINNGLTNQTGRLLAIESLNSSKQQALLTALLSQLPEIINNLVTNLQGEPDYIQSWLDIQTGLRQEALREFCGSYKRIIKNGNPTQMFEELISLVDLSESDQEIPPPSSILDSLVMNKPIVLEGQHYSTDEPRALLQLEMLLTNWLIRNAEIISAEIVSACSQWPEIRSYFLKANLISTRELERVRNQLNSQNRWLDLVQKPINLYESKRVLYKINNSSIELTSITEPRDDELRQLSWFQQQVALLVEARDALAPQIQIIVKRIGDLLVVLLTQVIGRAIGLIGRGIAQGMGRSLSRS